MNFNLKSIICIGVLFISINNEAYTQGQQPKKDSLITTPQTSQTQSSSTDLTPQVIPPSPNAAALGKFGDIPVSYYTGLANTSVPLYTIQDKDIVIPISLSYHHGGIRVEEDASWAGLGWALNAGGAITRTIRGRDDFHPLYGYAFNKPIADYLPNPAADTYFTDKINGQYLNPPLDTEPDLFYYNIGGSSGKFILSASPTNTFPIAGILLDKSDVSIKCISRTGTSRDNYKYIWEIIDSKGIKYTFSEQEINAPLSASNITPQSAETNLSLSPAFSFNYEKTHNITAWYITSIYSAQTNTTVQFNYNRAGKFFSTSRISASQNYTESGTIISPNPSDPNCTTPQALTNGDLAPSTSISINVSRNAYLKSIVFSTGSVEFITNDRDDIQRFEIAPNPNLPFSGSGLVEGSINDNTVFESNQILNPQKIAHIDIKDKAGNRIKRWSFSHSYFNSTIVGTLSTTPTYSENMKKYNNLRLRLDEVKEYNKDLTLSLPGYKFTYTGDILTGDIVTTPVSLPSKVSWAKDYWGYYNGKTDNNSKVNIIPQIAFPKMAASKTSFDYIFNVVGFGNTFENGIDRTSDINLKQLGALQKMYYPTGGSTTFEYESNMALTGTEEVQSNLYESKSGNTSPSFLITSSGTFADITFKLECTTSPYQPGVTSPLGCTYIADNQAVYAKVLNGSTEVYVRRYADWSSKVCVQIPIGNQQVQDKCTYTFSVKNVALTPGNYQLFSYNNNGLAATAKIVTYKYNTGTNYVENPTGGIRIKKIQNFDGTNIANTKIFEYKLSGGEASGKQMKNPILFCYGYKEILQTYEMAGQSIEYPCKNLIWGIKIQANSLTPLGTSANGNHVGYSRVTTKDIDLAGNDIGKTIYEYVNIPDAPIETSLFYDIPTKQNVSNGMLLKETYLRQDDFKVKEVLYSLPEKKVNVSQNFKGMRFYIGVQMKADGSSFIRVVKSSYDIPADFWFSSQKTENTYDISDLTNTNFVSNITTTKYDGISHIQVTSVKTFNSKGEVLETTYKYPHEMIALGRDDTESTYSSMVSSHVISPVIEEISTINGTQNDLKLTEFKKWYSSFFAPKSMKTQIQTTDPLITRLTYNNYNQNGNIISYTERNGITTFLDWWDTYDANKAGLLKSKTIGQGALEQISQYDYYPLIGVKRVTEPRGIHIDYNYDTFNRLIDVRDYSGKVIKSYQYNYKGQ